MNIKPGCHRKKRYPLNVHIMKRDRIPRIKYESTFRNFHFVLSMTVALIQLKRLNCSNTCFERRAFSNSSGSTLGSGGGWANVERAESGNTG